MSTTYKAEDITPQSLAALSRFIGTRGAEPLRELLAEVHSIFTRREDVTVGSDTYNGWTNHETWAVSWHLSIDQGLYNDTRQRLARAWLDARAEHPEPDWERYWMTSGGHALKDWVTDELLSPDYWRDDFGAPMPRELEMMRGDCGSLWRVDWFEIAANWLGDMHPDELAEIAAEEN